MKRVLAIITVVVFVAVVQALSPVSSLLVNTIASVLDNIYANLTVGYVIGSTVLVMPGLLYAYYRKRSGNGIIEYVRLQKPPLDKNGIETLSYGLIATLTVFIGLNIVIAVLNLPVAENQAVTSGTANPTIIPLLMFFTLILVAPAEEFIYRGIVQRRLEEAFHPYAAIGVASFLFGLVHVTAVHGTIAGNAVYVGFIGGISLVWGYYYYKTENLAVPIILHGLYNFILYISMVVQFLL